MLVALFYFSVLKYRCLFLIHSFPMCKIYKFYCQTLPDNPLGVCCLLKFDRDISTHTSISANSKISKLYMITVKYVSIVWVILKQMKLKYLSIYIYIYISNFNKRIIRQWLTIKHIDHAHEKAMYTLQYR